MRKGFTVLELLIVISITVMMSALAISYRSSTQQQVGLYVEVQKLAELILRAKSLAISTYNDPGQVLPFDVVNCGYGINVDYDRNGYDLFSYQVKRVGQGQGQDCENINIIKDGNGPNADKMVILSSHDVAPGVFILENRTKQANPNKSIHIVFFVPPAPITLIGTTPGGSVCGPPTNCPGGKIYLTTKDASLNAAISISSIGQVDF